MRRACPALALLALPALARATHAQPTPDSPPRFDALVTVDAGARPAIPSAGSDREGLLGYGLGVRVHADRRWFGEAWFTAHERVFAADYVTVASVGTQTIRRSDAPNGATHELLAAQARGGHEHARRAPGPRVRAAVGGGYAITYRQPFASAGVGLTSVQVTDGATTRLTG